jgi:hypothetical protein
MNEEALLRALVKQNEVIIGLLARMTIGVDAISEIVTRGKRDPDAYLRAYNALDGTITVTEAARIAGVAQPTMSEVLKTWETYGIVYDIGEPNRPVYRRLLQLPEEPPSRKQGKKGRAQ